MSARKIAVLSETGQVREINEDSVLDLSHENLWAVADGMGGHKSGDYASQLVTDTLRRYQATAYRGGAINQLNELLSSCNSHLVAKAASENAGIIGCTVSVLSFHGPDVVCSWSGDSRIYRVRKGVLTLLTRDHNYESLSEDRDIHFYPDKPAVNGQLLTGAIGGGAVLALEHCWYGLQKGDEFLLCTDGLYKEVTDSQIQEVVGGSGNLECKVGTLAELYNQGGARDNVGMVLVGPEHAQ